ncbi:peptidoglycan DD-metalloendopeptidase family protein [uncultured Christiangramia sp.]|uniref:peptidoglycan DD-metalloendopeptidase family protein n=1 Tax=uncultured Christiangramia sp. TaxID=503836 RepID=UPI002627B4A7|nr:peptidoglycan DD-metalloendopeptidase family protein [uncultured Christiangramia sp.]
MKRALLVTILFLAVNLISAQTEKPIDKIVLEKFENNFNSNDFEKIFNSFSNEMQKALPHNKAIKFLTDFKNQAGKIKFREFKKYEKGTFASYKTVFENGVFALNISTDKNSKINGFYIEPFKEDNLPIIERNSTKLILPFQDEWTVTWGGDTAELNYHVENKAQKNAFDFIVTDEDGKSYKTDGRTNEDYYAFGKKLISPCDAEVILKIDGIEDNVPGELNPMYVPGNTVILKTANNEYLFFAHFKQNTIEVEQGQKVKKGEVLGLCGNSGNSSEPHLHFHIQNVKNINVATGVKSYFEEIKVNGEIKKNYSPIKGDKISNTITVGNNG